MSGIPFLFLNGQTNLALNKECRQSSTLNNKTKFSAGVVVDGNTIQQMQVADSCSHTEHYEPFNWWTVDLGQLFTVDTITIYNREDSCCVNRLADYDVLVYNPVISTWEDYNKSTPDLCYHHVGISPLVINITCPNGTIGRYVQVYKPNGVVFNITQHPLSLCEVEVYGRRILTDPADTVIEITTDKMIEITTDKNGLSTDAEDTVIEIITVNSLSTDDSK
ncbi:fucolectin-3-like [Mytilus trossulus]|uniref:fucolectin-3-like n=1 Tax=Mytilus trossulus TaxID=6551 RepID=UPI0030060B99